MSIAWIQSMTKRRRVSGGSEPESPLAGVNQELAGVQCSFTNVPPKSKGDLCMNFCCLNALALLHSSSLNFSAPPVKQCLESR